MESDKTPIPVMLNYMQLDQAYMTVCLSTEASISYFSGDS